MRRRRRRVKTGMRGREVCVKEGPSYKLMGTFPLTAVSQQ